MVVLSPLAYPGYDWMTMVVSELSAVGAPSADLANRLNCLFGPVGTGLLPASVFGLFERFGTFSVVVFNAVLGMYLFFGKFESENTRMVQRTET